MLKEHLSTLQNCRSMVLFLTAGDTEDVLEKIKNYNKKNLNTIIFTYTLGGDSYVRIPIQIAELTNGIHVHTNDDDPSLITSMSLYYMYYAFSQPQIFENNIILTSPYLSAYTQQSMITLAMPIYLKNEYFVGVAAIDIPLSFLKHSIGDAVVGPNSYWFVMNSETELVLHPNIPDPDIITNEYKPVYVHDVEPAEFGKSVVTEMRNRVRGFKQVTAKIKQSAGDVKYNGFVDQIATLLYNYSPVGPSSLSIAIVMFTTPESVAPFVPSVRLKSVPSETCDSMNWNFTDSSHIRPCISSFRLYNELNLMVQCRSVWLREADIINSEVLQESDIYGQKFISLKYPKYHLQPGLWKSESKAIYTDATCSQLNTLHEYTNRMDDSLPYELIQDDLPYDGFRSDDLMIQQIEIFTTLHHFWKSAYLSEKKSFISCILALMRDCLYNTQPYNLQKHIIQFIDRGIKEHNHTQINLCLQHRMNPHQQEN